MTHVSLIGLRVVLALAGAFIVFTGLNVALGGIATLGWQGQTPFLQVTDGTAFLAQDSHVRFLGGLWTAMGLLFIVAARSPAAHRSVLLFAYMAIFLGGLARLSQFDFDTLLGPDIVGSLAAELIGMPLLFFWTLRAAQSPAMPGQVD